MIQLNHRVSATDINWYLRSPFALWCNYNAGSEERDVDNLEVETRMEQGLQHEENVYSEQYPDVQVIDVSTIDEAVHATKLDLAAGTAEILQGTIRSEELGLYGRPDILSKIDGAKSIFGQHAYRVTDIKLAKNLREWHILPTAFYAWLMNHIQNADVDEFGIIDLNQTYRAFSLRHFEDDLIEIMHEVEETVLGAAPRPVYGETPHPWSAYGNRIAAAAGDITVIAGVKAAKANALRDHGLNDIVDVVAAGPTELTKIKGFGHSTAQKVWTKAAALHLQKPVPRWDSEARLASAPRLLFLDIETVGEPFLKVDDPLVYMIGVLERMEGKEEFRQFTMNSPEDERTVYEEFLGFLAGSRDDGVIVHFGSYEKTHLDKLSRRHDERSGFIEQIEHRLHDLSKPAGNIAFPVPGDTLKDLASWMGFDWKRPPSEASAMLSCQAVIDWWATKGESDEIIEPVKSYNEDDCRATAIVYDWLANEPTDELAARLAALMSEADWRELSS